MSKHINVITAFLAALVATPSDEDLPTFTSELITNTNIFIKNLRQQPKNLAFWQRFDEFHDQLDEKYTDKERAKLNLPDGTPEDARGGGENELGNVMISAEEILESKDAIATAREAFQTSGYTDHLSWAMGITGWQP